MKGKLGDKQCLVHILESIEEIEKYTAGSNLEVFLQNSIISICFGQANRNYWRSCKLHK